MAANARGKQSGVLARFREHGHDHARCVAEAVGQAEDLCAAEGVQLTPLRRRVLELVWNSHAAVGAYDLLDALRADGRRAAPLTVYRALDFLRGQGLVHRVESLNAYVGCGAPRQSHSAQLLICRSCRSVAELDDADLADSLADRAGALGFQTERQTVELLGLCPSCAA